MSSHTTIRIGRFAQFTLVLCTLALSACAPTEPKPALDVSPQATKVDQGAPGLISGPGIDPADVAACNAKGGGLQHVCLMGKIACVVTFADAGKACTDGSQCESKRCLVEYSATDDPKVAMKGVCKGTDNPCGCFTYMENGKPGPGLCVD